MALGSNSSCVLYAIRNHRRKSLQLPWPQRGQRNLQVLRSPRTPKAWGPGHPPEAQGMEITMSMAPLKKQIWGWLRLFQILPANYGFFFDPDPPFFFLKT